MPPSEGVGHTVSAQRPGCVPSAGSPLDQMPSLPPLRGPASPALFGEISGTTHPSDFSWPCIIGYGSMPSRCGPDGFCLWSATRSPGSRARSVRTCQGLRPRRVGGRLAITPPAVLPSAVSTASAPRSRLSRLNGWPLRSPVNASTHTSRRTPHDSGPVWIATPSRQWTFTTYSLPVSRRTETAASQLPQCEVSL